ncbi:iron chelate uptake ABC transporter family permease subunit [Pontibacillus litoralis]|uniref:Iron ABC transporter permease n=1 Tax=Pontibacillus litoralis JSM 072002 TaxID=1385512 RepID=A0A0A5HRC4_9BACI|nr:iron chelate uptake ABC transporter family permease subunit [Pontibacillus litoralis]KGX86187.1 iron ABC transporter permease [Pontibacillus litoralis JSM 072002]
MSHKKKIIILAVIAFAFIGMYLFMGLNENWDYVLPNRATKVFAIILTGGCIAFSTVVFQTITNNRILTPSLIGLDSLYLLIQTVIVFLFGAKTLALMESETQFILSVGLMVLFAYFLFIFIFKKEGRNIYFLLLIGIIFGTFFNSIASFMQMLIDPNEFAVVQDTMFASFNNVNEDLFFISVILIIMVTLYFLRFVKYLDVISLGRDHALNLGVPYDQVVKQLLIVVAILVSVATALVGPITFLGLLVANVAHEFLKTYRHSYLITGAILISIIALVGGQLLVERIFTFSTTISVIINFVGGIYFLYLLLKENRSW